MNFNLLKKIVGLLLISSMLILLAACGTTTTTTPKTSTTGQQETVTIKFFHRFPDEPYNTFLDDMIKIYTDENPNVKIEVTKAQNDPYKEKIKVIMGTDDQPDIFFSWVGDFTNRFIREGLLMDLTDAFNKDQAWKDSLMPEQVAAYYTDGKLYGIPFRLDAKAFFYNKEIFTANGISIPKNFEELLQICEKLKSKGITPLSYGNQEKWPSQHYIGTLNQKLVDNTVRLKDYNPKTGEFTDTGYVQALQYYQKLIPYFNEYVNGTTHELARQNFASGKSAMMYLETIEVGYLEAAMAKKFDYGMFIFPAIPEGKGDQGYVTGAPEGFVVTSKAKYPEETIKFLKYITGPEVGKKQIRTIRWYNASLGAIDDTFKDAPIIDSYNILKNATGLAYWLDNDLHAKLVDKYMSGISDLTNGDTTPEKLMEEIKVIAKQVQQEVG